MSKLTKPFQLQTAFADYQITELLGEGGAGRVFGGEDGDGFPVAIKLLTNSTSDKRRRFKNEITFLSRNKHENIVSVLDHGLADQDAFAGPFYVMTRYDGSLRELLRSQASLDDRLKWFGQILNGVEAAHMLGATHRDLKPENILYHQGNLAIADFGVASFSAEALATLVETKPGQRLANFQYAAPEQRAHGSSVGVPSDIYTLGLMLNELFTGEVPQGTDYRVVAAVSSEFGFLDRLVAEMIRQNPDQRPRSVADVRFHIEKYRSDAISLQRLSRITSSVIPAGEIDDPLALEPPRLVGAEWSDGILKLTLDRPVSYNWVVALQSMEGRSSVLRIEPAHFRFQGNVATVGVHDVRAQAVIDQFKNWLPIATRTLRSHLERELQRELKRREELLLVERRAEETRIRVNQSLRV